VLVSADGLCYLTPNLLSKFCCEVFGIPLLMGCKSSLLFLRFNNGFFVDPIGASIFAGLIVGYLTPEVAL